MTNYDVILGARTRSVSSECAPGDADSKYVKT